MSDADQVKELRARLDKMQAALTEAKQSMAEEKEQRQKTVDKLATIQSDAADLNIKREQLIKLNNEIMNDVNLK